MNPLRKAGRFPSLVKRTKKWLDTERKRKLSLHRFNRWKCNFGKDLIDTVTGRPKKKRGTLKFRIR